MARYAVVTINGYHDTGLEWRDGEANVFHYGGEFDAEPEQLVAITARLAKLSRFALEITSQTKKLEEISAKLVNFKSPVEQLINEILGRGDDPENPSSYILLPNAANFWPTEIFEVHEIGVAEVVGGNLSEIARLSLKGSDKPHAIETLIRDNK